jgi:hypothetical protein
VAAGRLHRTQEEVVAWAAGRLPRRVLLPAPVHLLVVERLQGGEWLAELVRSTYIGLTGFHSSYSCGS